MRAINGGRSGSEGIMGVPEGMRGPQRVRGISKGVATISEGVVWASKKILRASKKDGEILRCCEVFKGRVLKKKKKKKENGEISICDRTIGHCPLQGRLPKSKRCSINSFSRPFRCNIDQLSVIFTG